jgi:PEP-CTERM motif
MRARILTIAVLVVSAFAADALTIDQMYVSPFGHHTQTYDPLGTGLMIMGFGDYYVLNNGSSWDSGAGSTTITYLHPALVEIDGVTIRYILEQPTNGVLFRNTDYNYGDHSAQGVLGVAGPLVIEAQLGASTATMTGFTEILSNDETSYGEPRFNYYSADVGDQVLFQIDYVFGTPCTESLFDSRFTYHMTGVVDFTQVRIVPEPATVGLFGAGLASLVALSRRRRS